MMVQKFDPHVVKAFIVILKIFVRRRFPEPRKTSPKGRPRCGKRWVLVLLCMLGRLENVRWRDLEKKLQLCTFLVEEGYLNYIPSKSTFHRVWKDIELSSVESLIRGIGYKIAKKVGDDAFAVDSSGFKMILGSIWRLLKWDKKKLKKTSPIFKKVHMGVSLPSRSIVTITTTPSTTHDSKALGTLLNDLYKRLIDGYDRMYGDSAYWAENIFEWLKNQDIFPVITPKSNYVDHGTDSVHDCLVRAYEQYSGLFKRNHHPEFREAVEHVFGLIKLKTLSISDWKEKNQLKSLLTPFIWYNFGVYVQQMSCDIG